MEDNLKSKAPAQHLPNDLAPPPIIKALREAAEDGEGAGDPRADPHGGAALRVRGLPRRLHRARAAARAHGRRARAGRAQGAPARLAQHARQAQEEGGEAEGEEQEREPVDLMTYDGFVMFGCDYVTILDL